MAVIPGARRGDLAATAGTGGGPELGKVSPYHHIAHIEQDLREGFRLWFGTFTNSDEPESIEELQLAESDCGIVGSGGYYQRVLVCLCKGSRKIKARVCTRSDRSGLVSIIFDLAHLRSATVLLDAVMQFPAECALVMDDEIKSLITTLIGDDLARGELPFTGVKCVFRNHPTPKALRNLDPAVDMLSLVSIKGICLRLSSVLPEMQVAVFRCEGKASRNFQHVTCNTEVSRPVVNGCVEEPLVCDSCQSHKTFVLDHSRCVFISKQLCKLQEHPDEVVEGEPPQMIFLFLYDNLVDNCKAGDAVSVVGIYKPLSAKVAARSTAVRGLYRVAIDVMSIDRAISNETTVITPQAAALFTADFVSQAYALAGDPNCYEILVNSFAPEIWGLANVKKGLLCQLFGGVSEYIQDASKRLKSRGEIHILLCGDPAVAKSQLVRYVNKLSSRSVYVVGSGATSAGMTASIVRDPETREIVIESGAILLSDNGICCIDEFDKMDPITRAVLHEVMEQQTISFAKAGIISSLNARTSILASANPIRSKYDRSKTIVENINLPSNLMTRFDLIFLCLDVPNPIDDARLSQHVCELFSAPEVRATMKSKSARHLDTKFFAKYVAYARASCSPRVGAEAQQGLLEAYVELRQTRGSNPIGNPRQLDSLVRLATALAKMRLDTEVRAEHVREAARLVRESTYEALTDKNGRIDYDQLVTGKSNLQRERQTLIANEVLRLLKAAAPGQLTVDEIQEATNVYLLKGRAGEIPEANALGTSSQDKEFLFGELSRRDELSSVLNLLQNMKQIGPLTNQSYLCLI